MNRIRGLRDLKRLGSCPEGVAFARKFRNRSTAWNVCERADWMMCVLVQGKLLNKSKALKLALAFAERSPTRAAYRWVTRVASAGSDADAAGDAWAASDTSAFSMVYASGPDFDNSIYAIELRWQAEKIKQIVGNPFKASESNKME